MTRSDDKDIPSAGCTIKRKQVGDARSAYPEKSVAANGPNQPGGPAQGNGGYKIVAGSHAKGIMVIAPGFMRSYMRLKCWRLVKDSRTPRLQKLNQRGDDATEEEVGLHHGARKGLSS